MRRISIVLDESFNQANCYECAQVTIEEKGGQKRSRLVTIGSLLRAMTRSTVRRRTSIPIGKIPFGYYESEVGENQGKLCATVITVLPASRQMIQYENTMYDVYLPSLVFRFEVDCEMLRSTSVYVLKDETPSDKSKLYRYPFGNVSMEGRVCWGSNVLPRIKELKTLESVMMLFIQSPGNSDYFKGKEYCGHKDYTLRQLLEKLKDEETYPGNFLVPLKRNGKNVLLKDLNTWKQILNKS